LGRDDCKKYLAICASNLPGQWSLEVIVMSIPDAACSILLTTMAKIFALDFRKRCFIVLWVSQEVDGIGD
jgi:hypothetical protein